MDGSAAKLSGHKNLDSTEHDDDEDATVFRFRLDGLRQSDHLEAAELRLYLRATEPRQ
uniref:Uncharacterized protein n=1 Tax=Plectus sambesii TaxID=2011161 RepID=A0A914VQT2_9BILA